MKKLLFLSALLIFACSIDDDSTLKITNDTNEDFIFTQISFGSYEFSNLNLQYGESQVFNLNDGLNGVALTTLMGVSITYVCSSQEWAVPGVNGVNIVDFDRGSQTIITLTYETDCGDSEYCTNVCLSYCCDT